MTVRIVLELQIGGDGDTERSLRESCAWLNKLGEHTSEFHEVMGYLAMFKARQEWRLADVYKDLERGRAARLERAAARRAAKATGEGQGK